jgi:hypothetical protein
VALAAIGRRYWQNSQAKGHGAGTSMKKMGAKIRRASSENSSATLDFVPESLY